MEDPLDGAVSPGAGGICKRFTEVEPINHHPGDVAFQLVEQAAIRLDEKAPITGFALTRVAGTYPQMIVGGPSSYGACNEAAHLFALFVIGPRAEVAVIKGLKEHFRAE